MDEIVEEAPERWKARPFLLAALGVATGIVVHSVLGHDNFDMQGTHFAALRAALLIGVTVGAVLIGFTIERRGWWVALAFGVVMGVMAGLVSWWNGPPYNWSQGEVWRTMSMLLAVAIAAPLFQAARGERSWRPSYPAVHDHLWANVVLWFASWAFVGLVFILTVLLANLFQLIKIRLLYDLLNEYWFCRVLIGLAFGSALGVLREHDAVVRTLQRVVTTLLAVLAPALAIGLALFLLALPFTGVQALWDATSETTPLLLACAAGALIFCNDVIGADEAEERRNPLLRYSAMLLAAVILPLAVLAGVATGLRVGQYGYTPERLWAVVFVGIACLWGAAYLVALVRGRMHWAQRVRPANLVLAALVCALGFVLATPLISFNRISTDDQLARLKDGRTRLDTFDWAALAFDFGEPGRNALAQLRRSTDPKVRAPAEKVAKAENRWDYERGQEVPSNHKDEVLANARVLPAGTALPQGLPEAISRDACTRTKPCTLFVAGPGEVFQLSNYCFAGSDDKRVVPRGYCAGGTHYVLTYDKWAEPVEGRVLTEAQWTQIVAGYPVGKTEVRKVERRQLFVGGVPVGDAFE